jgi:hypothetical protein
VDHIATRRSTIDGRSLPTITGASAAEPKELLVIPGARKVDRYDRADPIPFAGIAPSFARKL